MFTHVHAYTHTQIRGYLYYTLAHIIHVHDRHNHMPVHTCPHMFMHMVPFAQPRLFVSPGSLITCTSSTRMTTEPQPATCGSDMGSPWPCLLPTLLLLLFLNSENPPQEAPEKLPLHCLSHPQGGTKGPPLGSQISLSVQTLGALVLPRIHRHPAESPPFGLSNQTPTPGNGLP